MCVIVLFINSINLDGVFINVLTLHYQLVCDYLV